MNLHEYQAKEVLREFGVTTPNGVVVSTVEDAINVADQMDQDRWVVKAQVHAGGRGKAGGVRLVKGHDEIKAACTDLLGSRLVTQQTDELGQPINSLLLESTANIAREFYISFVVDRGLRRVVIMASTEGGMDIEEVADQSPEKILSVSVDPVVGFQPYLARQLFFQFGCDKSLLRPFVKLVSNLYDAFIQRDMSMLEINPLILTAENDWVCLDAKVDIDENALYRQPEMAKMRDVSQEDERETLAKEWDLSYIALEGNIACMVNGAGLAMATMDLIKLNGGNPANFLDVGGGATQERVTAAFEIITSDPDVKAIFINIFGGIVRCDLIAEGIIQAVQNVGLSVPVVVRLQGNRAAEGSELLAKSDVDVFSVNKLSDAARRVVELVAAE